VNQQRRPKKDIELGLNLNVWNRFEHWAEGTISKTDARRRSSNLNAQTRF
jgi:hypothetical protein